MNPSAGRYNRLSRGSRQRVAYDNGFIWEIARAVDYPADTTGRPNTHPLWVYYLWMILIHEYGSSRKVEEAFEDKAHGPWPHIREAAERELSDQPHLIPPADPPSRNQFNYALKHHLPARTETITNIIRNRSQRLAAALGLGTDTAPGSISRPSTQRVAYGDVTVMTARSKTLPKHARVVDQTTGEIRHRRHDPDIGLHTTGGGNVIPGLPYAFTHIRGPRRNEQVILAIDPITPNGPTEGNIVVDQYLQAAQHLPGLIGYAYDRALRGTHLDRLLKAGHIGLVGVHKTKGKPPDRYHGQETHHKKTGPPKPVDIHLIAGAPHIRTYDVDGNQHLTPLTLRRINKRINKTDQTVRLSAEYDVPTPTGEPDGYIRIRLDQTAEDKITGYNRPEHLRAFPESHDTFNTIQKPLRASAESANRYIDDHHPRERLHHYGFQRNTLSMLAWQTHQNAQTETIFARHPLPHPEPLSQTG